MMFVNSLLSSPRADIIHHNCQMAPQNLFHPWDIQMPSVETNTAAPLLALVRAVSPIRAILI